MWSALCPACGPVPPPAAQVPHAVALRPWHRAMDQGLVLVAGLALLLLLPLFYFVFLSFWSCEHVRCQYRLLARLQLCGSKIDALPTQPGAGDDEHTAALLHDQGFLDVVGPARRGERAVRHILLPTLRSCLEWYLLLFGMYTGMALLWYWSGWRHKPKNMAGRFADIECVFLHGMTLMLFGVEQRLSDPAQRRLFIGLILYNLGVYSLVYEAAPNLTLTAESMDAFGLQMAAVLGVAAAVILLVLSHHALIVWHQPATFQWLYYGVLVLGLAFVGVGIAHAQMHLHHYWWGWLLAHFPVFDTKASLAAQACCIAFFLHGLSLFGCARLFNDTHCP